MTVQITKTAKYIGGGIENMTDAMIEDYNSFTANEKMQDDFAMVLIFVKVKSMLK